MAKLGGPWKATRVHTGPSSVVDHLKGPKREAYLKQHHSAKKANQEIAAYRWLKETGFEAIPELWLHFEDALLLAPLPGSEQSWGTHRLDEAAGRLLARLHQLPIRDRDPMPLNLAYAKRAEACLQKRLPGNLRKPLESLAEARFELGSRVFCHRDFGPSNLWTGRDGRLYLFDFEHAQPDLAWSDWSRMATQPWLDHPERKQAFQAGYREAGEGTAGEGAAWPEPALERALLALELAQTLIWCEGREDPHAKAQRARAEMALRAWR